MELWKDIEGTNGKYQASTEGRIKGERGILAQILGKDDYLRTHLPNYLNKSTLIHKLVAETFITIPTELEQYIGTQKLQVNHKDENKLNNNVENLEWCTAKYNSNYGTRNERMGLKLKGRRPSDNTIKASVERCSRKVSKYSKNDELIETYPSLAEAERQNEGIHHANIIKCCRGIIKSTGGFKWKYADC